MTPEQQALHDSLRERGYALLREAHEIFMAAHMNPNKETK